MRRRVDDWINATHILKVADFDKPARTRVLEREVQKNVHEKVQGGYGKYQGEFCAGQKVPRIYIRQLRGQLRGHLLLGLCCCIHEARKRDHLEVLSHR